MRVKNRVLEKYELLLVEEWPVGYTTGRRITKALQQGNMSRFYWYMQDWTERLSRFLPEPRMILRKG